MILLGVIVIIILYLVYAYVLKDNTSSALHSGGDATKLFPIPASMLPGNKESLDFTFSIWIYVKSWQYKYGEKKIIYRRTGKGGPSMVSPELSLGEATNDLLIRMSINSPEPSLGIVDGKDWKINNIPIQKWCNIIISTNNRAVDTYIDGKLVNTHVLAGVPAMNESEFALSPIELTPDKGFSGQTSKFKYFSRTISPREAYEIYREGPGGSWLNDLLNKYKLRMSFMKDNEEVNSFEI